MQAVAAHGHEPRAVVWPQDPQFATASAGKIAMWIFLVSDAFAFFGLLLAYGILHPGLSKEGLVFGRSAYASTFYVITSFHALHVFTGVVYISITLLRNALGRATAGQIELLGLFWHFVDLIWIFVFTLLYLIPV